MNSDLQTGCVLVAPGNDELVAQLSTCKWDAKGLEAGKYIEDPACKNDLADSFLYAHHFSRQHWYSAPIPRRQPTNDDRVTELTRHLVQKRQAELENGDYNGDIYGD